MLSWGPPHNPYRELPQSYLDTYPPDEIEIRPNCPDPDREDLSGYYAHVTALDEQLGRIQERLERRGLMDDTVFVYTSDHGDMVGSHGEHESRSRGTNQSVFLSSFAFQVSREKA